MKETMKDDVVVADNATGTEEIIAEDKIAENQVVAESQVVNNNEGAVPSSEVKSGDDALAKEETPGLEEQLAQAHREASENLERWQRSVAELANFKRRQEEQLKLQRDMIKAEVLEGVISALDDLDLAFQNVPEEIDGQLVGWVEGFRLVQRKLDKILDDQYVSPIDTNGHFDPNLHQAVSHEESENHAEGQIIAELRKGYKVGNRVLRPALVRVAK